MDYNKNFIIGVGSKARVGKDTLVNMFLQFFAAKNINAAIPHIVCVSDVRFPNEAFWIKKNGGAFIHLDRLDGLGELFPPAGPDEAENDPILKEMADHKFIWESSNNNLSDCYYKGEQFFNEIFSQEQITTWQKDFPRI